MITFLFFYSFRKFYEKNLIYFDRAYGCYYCYIDLDAFDIEAWMELYSKYAS